MNDGFKVNLSAMERQVQSMGNSNTQLKCLAEEVAGIHNKLRQKISGSEEVGRRLNLINQAILDEAVQMDS